MPLIDLNETTGFTQFFMRSHKTSQLIGFGEAASTLRLSFDGILKAGQNVLYDYRLLHRGMANNTTSTVRPVLLFLYTVPAYKELQLRRQEFMVVDAAALNSIMYFYVSQIFRDVKEATRYV